MAFWNKSKKKKDIILKYDDGFKLDLNTEESIVKIDLRRSEVNHLCETKHYLNGVKSRVALVLDYSSSMLKYYKNETVQSVVERILPLACQFDDNKELDLWIFENSFKRLGSITVNNFCDYIKSNITPKSSVSKTSYTPVMKDIISYYTKENASYIPAYIIFITDGDASDKNSTTNFIKNTSNLPVFWQYVGIGNNSFGFLNNLDNLRGRYIDNVNFFNTPNINEISDLDLYEKLLKEYPSWIDKFSQKV